MQMLNSTNNIKVAKYFKLSEFACPCCKLVMLHPKLLAKLVELRNMLERPVYITSGYRCSGYNRKVGGGNKQLSLYRTGGRYQGRRYQFN